MIESGKVRFRSISGFPGYQVGDNGTVIGPTGRPLGTVDRRRGKVTGYLRVALMRNGKRHMRRVHRLVLEAFVGLCPVGMEGCHGPGGLEDNTLTNLRWDTSHENGLDRYRHGVMPTGEAHHRAKLTKEKVAEIRVLLKQGFSERKVAAKYGVSKGTVAAIKRCRTWTIRKYSNSGLLF